MISVVIPTFNRRGFVKEAVASVLAQTGIGAEDGLDVIVVDDGSTDGTDLELESFGSSIRYVRQKNGGVSSARNRGIGMARFPWIAFLDSDDLWLPRKLSVQVDYLARHPGIRICQTEEIWQRNGLRLNPKKYHKKPHGQCFPLLLDRCLVSPSAVMIHREVFEDVGLFDESLPACEDYDMWLRIGCRYPIALVDEPLIVKRGGHADQLSATVLALDRYRIQSLAGLLLAEFLTPSHRELALDALRRKCRIYATGCRKRGKAEEAGRALALPDQVEKLRLRTTQRREDAKTAE